MALVIPGSEFLETSTTAVARDGSCPVASIFSSGVFVSESFCKTPQSFDVVLRTPWQLKSLSVGVRCQRSCVDALRVLVWDNRSAENVETTENLLASAGRISEFVGSDGILEFTNERFTSRRGWRRHQDHRSNSSVCLRMRGRAAKCVKKLRLIVTRMTNSRSISVSGISLKGSPCVCCVGDAEASRIYASIFKQEVIAGPGPSLITPTVSEKQQSCSSVKKIPPPCSSTEEVPEEYVDAITCEIMTFPVTLPSGLAVDKSTWERLKAEECRSGRIIARDPFSGLPLPDYPVLDERLKLKIDAYFSAGAVGGEGNSSKLLDGNQNTGCPSPPSKKGRVERRTQIMHEEGESVDDVLQKLIKAAPWKNTTHSLDTIKCVVCEQCPSPEYKFNRCGHFVCRSCLTDNFEVQCTVCHEMRKAKQVTRTHVCR